MMKSKSRLWVLSTLLVLGACSSTGRNYVKNEMQETLEVEILPNASKMFVYRLRWPDEFIPSPVRVVTSRGESSVPPTRGGVDISRSTPERLLENAAYVVKEAGYCRDGFFELDRSLSRYHLWLKGECKEGASAVDQQNFGTQKTLTPKDWRKS